MANAIRSVTLVTVILLPACDIPLASCSWMRCCGVMAASSPCFVVPGLSVRDAPDSTSDTEEAPLEFESLPADMSAASFLPARSNSWTMTVEPHLHLARYMRGGTCTSPASVPNTSSTPIPASRNGSTEWTDDENVSRAPNPYDTSSEKPTVAAAPMARRTRDDTREQLPSWMPR